MYFVFFLVGHVFYFVKNSSMLLILKMYLCEFLYFTLLDENEIVFLENF